MLSNRQSQALSTAFYIDFVSHILHILNIANHSYLIQTSYKSLTLPILLTVPDKKTKALRQAYQNKPQIKSSIAAMKRKCSEVLITGDAEMCSMLGEQKELLNHGQMTLTWILKALWYYRITK